MAKGRAYDLAAGAQKLVGPEYNSLRKSIQIALSTESTFLDLQEVQSSLEALVALGQGEDKSKVSSVGRALLTHAIVVYARASHSQSKRFKIGIDAAYSPEQMESHESVLELRDKSIAHIGKGRREWHSERFLFLNYGDGRAGLTFAHKRTNVSFWIATVMLDLVSTALEYVRTRKSEAADRVDSEMLKLDQTEADLLLSVPFDASDFFGIDEDRFWEIDSFSNDRNAVDDQQ